MKIWLPYVKGGSGTDIFTKRLAKGLRESGLQAEEQEFPHYYQYIPWSLKNIEPPKKTEIILTNSWNGFAFHRPGIKLIVVEHLFVLDPFLLPYSSFPQKMFYKTLINYFERNSARQADKIVAVSQYTAQSMKKVIPNIEPVTILNGIDTNFFHPVSNLEEKKREDEKIRLLFVGNMSRRKGFDLLPQIMENLGKKYELAYTSGLRTNNSFDLPSNMRPLGRLNQNQIKQAYQDSDLMLFPTRMEGLPLSAMEAMACGTPVVASKISSLPEIIEDDVSGALCPLDDVSAFAETIVKLSSSKEKLDFLSGNARKRVETHFSFDLMLKKYIDLFLSL